MISPDPRSRKSGETWATPVLLSGRARQAPPPHSSGAGNIPTLAHRTRQDGAPQNTQGLSTPQNHPPGGWFRYARDDK
jgi:hypothetical protein